MAHLTSFLTYEARQINIIFMLATGNLRSTSSPRRRPEWPEQRIRTAYLFAKESFIRCGTMSSWTARSLHRSLQDRLSSRFVCALLDISVTQSLLLEQHHRSIASHQTSLQVLAYYAPQFAALRWLCIQGGEESFLASISRCRKWESKGGKSNVYFAKSRDER